MSSKVALLRNRVGRSTVNFPDFQEFEESLLRDSEVVSLHPSKAFQLFSCTAFSFIRRLAKVFPLSPPYELPLKSPHETRVAILGGPAFRRCPGFIWKGRKIAYLFDPTPPWASYEAIADFVSHTGIRLLFVPHPVFKERLTPVLKNCKVHFLAEAVDPGCYQWSGHRPIDLLSFGRKLKSYHADLVEGLPATVRYRHGPIENRADFKKALSEAKIVINFPRSITRSQNLSLNDLEVEMVTMRYFQSIASKALPLGKCPPLLEKLFGYNPMIEADLDNPVDQVLDLLKHYADYLPLIEKNYEQLMARHTYAHRWQEMKAVIGKSLPGA